MIERLSGAAERLEKAEDHLTLTHTAGRLVQIYDHGAVVFIDHSAAECDELVAGLEPTGPPITLVVEVGAGPTAVRPGRISLPAPSPAALEMVAHVLGQTATLSAF
jgi:hypothetical protein